MKQWLNLSKKDMKHLVERKVHSKAEFWNMREAQAKMVEESKDGQKNAWEPCWECYSIEKKLKQVVKLFDLEKGDKFKVSPTSCEWTIVTFYGHPGQPKASMLVENDNRVDRYYTRSKNRDVIKVD